MLLEELKKIWIKQHILIVLVIFLIIQAVYVGGRGLYSHTVTKISEKNGKIYEEFYSQLKGKWSNEKEEKLDGWLQERNDSSIQYNNLVDQLLTGEISEEALYTYYHENPFCQTRYTDVLDELDQQRNYIIKNPRQRYMMNINGWTYFFEDHFVYYFYFLFLLILFIPLFIREKETKMDLLQGLSAKGQKKIFSNKILAAVITMCSGSFLLMIEKYVLYYVRCDMGNITFPIQSLTIFETCPWNVSISAVLVVEMFLLLSAGFLLGGVITVCSMFIPRTIDISLLILILVFVPMFVVSKEILFYYPNMTSLLFPTQLVYGWRDIDVGVQVYKTGKELLMIVIAAVLVGTVLLWIAQKRGQKV